MKDSDNESLPPVSFAFASFFWTFSLNQIVHFFEDRKFPGFGDSYSTIMIWWRGLGTCHRKEEGVASPCA